MPAKLNITGEVFTWLTVLEEAGRNKRGAITWKCRCKCGNIISTTVAQLKSQGTKSCGCYRRTYKSKKLHIKKSSNTFGLNDEQLLDYLCGDYDRDTINLLPFILRDKRKRRKDLDDFFLI